LPSRRLFLWMTLLLPALASYPVAIEPSRLTTTRLSLRLGAGIKAVLISDLHFPTSVYDPRSVVEIAGRERPDIILVAGDLVTCVRGIADEALEQALALIAHLSEVAPTYVVLGNHDHWAGIGRAELEDRLAQLCADAELLCNTAVKWGGVWVVGVDDPYTGHDDLDRALRGVKRSSGPVVLLAHSPQIIGRAAGAVDLVLAGHTHGGQVRIPWIGPLYVPLPPEYRRFDYGLFDVDGTLMFVTRGLGTTYFPLRLNCPPEVVVIEL